MGSGVSKPSGRHSDSRVSEVRSELVREAHAHAAGGGENSTFTLKFSLQDSANSLKPSGSENSKGKQRALSLPTASAAGAGPRSGVWGKLGGAYSASSAIQPIGSLDEMHDSLDAIADSSSSIMKESATGVVDHEHDDEDEDDDSDEYYEDDFEDEIGEWKKGDSIGSGSYGTVYLARDERTGSLMAVKEILIAEENDSDIATATKEVNLLRSLRDENIVKYLGSYVDNEAKKLYIFTEWVPGGNLEQNRKKFGGNETIVKRFTHQILHGVAYLHSKNIVHHDIKPSNILVDQHGVVKLADFGASRLISSSTCVNNESMRGTPNYMAPEVIKQTSRSRKSDIWSVGCSVLRLLTGQPFWGDTKFDSQISLLYYVANLEILPPLPGELSDEARSFITTCLEIDPVHRPSALELLQHPFVKQSDPKAPRSVHTSSFNNGSARVHTAPVDNVNRSKLAVENQLPAVTKRAVNSAPQPSTHLPRIRSGAAAAPKQPFVAPAVLPNAFDLPGGTDEGETSIPNFSTTVFPLQPGDTIAPIGAISQKRQTPYLVAKQTPFVNATSAAEYTFSEFENGLSAAVSTAASAMRAKESPSKWEEQPILTDAAQAEREQRMAQLAAEKRRKEDHERRYQEELAEFRRQMGH